jgi:cephalosporin-C deacetylase
MKPPFLRGLLLVLSAVLSTSCPAADLLLLGETDKPAVSYQPGEKMVFSVRVLSDGKPAEGVRLSWKRSGDDGGIEKGEAVSTNEPLVLTASIDRPGFVRMEVAALDAEGKPVLDAKEKPVTFEGSAGVEPEKLQGVPVPADFDQWWAARRAELTKVPLKVIEMKPMPETIPGVETFDVKVACAGGMPVSGYLSRTKGIAPGTAMARVSFQGYGVNTAGRQDRWVSQNSRPVIALEINAHGIENGLPREDYRTMGKTTLKGYGFDKEQNEHPETAYFYGMAMRVMRALDFIKSQPEWDGKTLLVEGGSQGGFQALLAASLDPQVTRCVAVKPWLCDLGGITLGRMKGWRPDYTPALDYYDPVHHAHRIHCETKLFAGLGDPVCPPSGISVLYNSLPKAISKRIEYQQGATHGTTPPDVVKFVIENTSGR